VDRPGTATPARGLRWVSRTRCCRCSTRCGAPRARLNG
jgi:hypothetical protein